MPNALTHYYFSQQLLKRLPETVKPFIEGREKAYYFASMGPDVLYGLKFGKDKAKANYGEDIHSRLVRESFTAAKNAQLSSDMLAFVLGQLSHYALDSVAHAYVYDYEHKRLTPKIDNSWQGDKHMLIEAAFDKYVTDTIWEKPNVKAVSLFDWGAQNRKLLKEYINDLIAANFNLKLSNGDVFLATAGFRAFVYLGHEGGAFKKKLSEVVEKKLGGAHLFTAGYRKSTPREWDILNLKKQPYNVVAEEKNEPCDYTFDEMFEVALEKGVEYIVDFLGKRENGGELKGPTEGCYVVNYDSRRL